MYEIEISKNKKIDIVYLSSEKCTNFQLKSIPLF